MPESPARVSVPEAKRRLLEFESVLERWSQRLEQIAAGVPDPRYHPESDDPLNDAANIQGLVRAMLFDDLPTLRRLARTAARSL